MNDWLRLVLALVLALPASARQEPGRTVPEASQIEVGAAPRYSFREPPLNAPGVRSLADLRGRPLLVGFWVTRCGVCVGGAVPSVLELSATHGTDLEVLLVESWTPPQESAAYALGRQWLGSRAMWTHEVPFPVGAGLPRCVLLDAEGRVVLEGNPVSMKVELERAVEREVELARRPPDDAPPVVRSAWVEFQRGRIGRALQRARGIAARTEDDELRAAAEAAARTFRGRAAARIDRIERLLEAGHYVRAEGLALEMQKGVDGALELEERVALVLKRLAADELKAEVDAAKALHELESELFREGPEPRLLKALEGFPDEHPDTRAVERARQLLRLATLT